MLFANGANIKTDKTKFYVIVNLNEVEDVIANSTTNIRN